MKDRKKTSFRCNAGVESFFSVKMLADLNRRVEFVGKWLFMESLVTGWKMLWENSGKDSYLFP